MAAEGIEILNELQQILNEGGELPPRTTNRLILAAVRELYQEILATRDDIQTLKLKAGVWGALAGLIPALGALLLALALRII